MNIHDLIRRSQNSFEDDPKKLTCINNSDPLISVAENSTLKIQPIWEEPIEHYEGFVYKDYIALNPKYNNIYLRSEVASRLYKASKNLPPNLQLVVKAGHRPLSVQSTQFQILVQKMINENKMKSDEALLFARTFIDDPAIKIPSHCSGAAVDVELYDKQRNEYLDFGSLMNTESELSFLHNKKITDVQKENRLILLTTMLRAGFAPTYVEWWHFSYGDRVWAYFYDEPQFLYGLIDPEL